MTEKNGIERERVRLRSALLRKRGRLTPECRGQMSLCIGNRLRTLADYRHGRAIMFYVSVRGEVETQQLIRVSLEKGARVSVPWCDRENGTISAAEIKDCDRDLVAGCFNIPAPPGDRLSVVPVENINLFIVPGVGFDWRGVRLGWGRGYYDRFLAGANPRAVKIGLAYEAQVLTTIESRPNDVLMDKIITEDRVIDCGKIGTVKSFMKE